MLLRRLAPTLVAVCFPLSAVAESPAPVPHGHAAPAAGKASPAAHAAAPEGPSADAALAELRAGNARFVKGKPKRPHQSKARVKELAAGQHPHAIVLGCSDSRVSPEIIFDQGLGDLFVVRVAGNISEPATLGSIEYAAEHLGAPVIVVLGHERCGAVKATCEAGSAPGNVGSLVREILPAVAVAKLRPSAAGLVEDTVHVNERLVADQLQRESPILAGLVLAGEVKIVTATYDLDTGEVTFH